MSIDLNGNVAIVTGGGSGIGLSCAEAFVAHGTDVMICGRTESKLQSAAESLAAAGPGRVALLRADVGKAEDVDRLITTTVETWGRLDYLVNNAGIGCMGRLTEVSVEAFDAVIETNLRGPFLCSRAAWPHLKETGGYIFNICSVAGKRGMSGAAAYCASKFGLLGLSKSLSEEGKEDGIRVSAICPGYVATPLVEDAPVPFEEMIQPEDIAKSLLHLLDMTDRTVVEEFVIERTGA